MTTAARKAGNCRSEVAAAVWMIHCPPTLRRRPNPRVLALEPLLDPRTVLLPATGASEKSLDRHQARAGEEVGERYSSHRRCRSSAKMPTASGLMQKVPLPRYNKRRSTIITSNIPWENWGEYLDDHLDATAIIDRLLHHSCVIVINGPSHRDWVHARRPGKAARATESCGCPLRSPSCAVSFGPRFPT